MKRKSILILTLITMLIGCSFITDVYNIYKNADIQDVRTCYIENTGEIGCLKCSTAYLLKFSDKINELKVK